MKLLTFQRGEQQMPRSQQFK